MPQLKKQWLTNGMKGAIGSEAEPLRITAYFLAGKGTPPDLDGAMVGLGDLLQKAGIVSNDRWIYSWDSSRVVPWSLHKGEPMTAIWIGAFDWGNDFVNWEEIVEMARAEV